MLILFFLALLKLHCCDEWYMAALCPTYEPREFCDCSVASCPAGFRCYDMHGPGCHEIHLHQHHEITSTSTTKRTTTQTSTITTRRTTPGATSVHLVQVLLSIYSGNQDPVFNVFYNNANFSDIVATAESRASIPLNGFLGYRGFLVTLYSHVGSHPVLVGKCSDRRFEEKLLHTIAKLTDTKGARLFSSTVTAVENAIKACH